MQPLSARDLVDLWDLGTGAGTVDKGLLLLAAAHPDASYAALSELSVGQRNRLLFQLRAATVGADLEARVACEACGELLEFSLDQRAICSGGGEPADPFELEAQGYRLLVRPVTGADLAHAALAPDAAAARDALLGSVVLTAERDAAMIDVSDLPEDVIAEVEAALGDRDTDCDIVLGLDCAACDHAWSAGFDVASFLWSEIAVLARHLLDEVDQLARHYGWSEAEILSLGAARRRHYLSRVTA